MTSAKTTTRENKSPMDKAIWELRQCHRAIGARLAKMQKKRAEQQAPTQQQQEEEVEETILDVDLAMLALSVCMLRLETVKHELRASFPRGSLEGEEQQGQRQAQCTWMQRGSSSSSWVPRKHYGWREQVDARQQFDEQQQQQQQHGDSDSSSGCEIIIKPRRTKSCREVRSLVSAESEFEFNKLWEECCSKDDSQNKASSPVVKIQKELEVGKWWEEQCSAPARVDEVKTRESSSSPMGKTSQQQETITYQTTRPSVTTTTTTSAFLSASDSLGDDKTNILSLRDIDDVLYYKQGSGALDDRGSCSTSSLMAVTDMVIMGAPVAHPLAREIATRRASAPPPENLQDSQGEGGYSAGSFWGKIVGSFRKVFTKSSSSTDTSGVTTRNIVVAQKVNETRFETLGG
ncbi:hypothetical protein V8F06_000661 [Rhypophila decipiens]